MLDDGLHDLTTSLLDLAERTPARRCWRAR
jgi:hypothetical protein